VKTARVLVNAAGPWIGEVAETVIRQPLPRPVRLIKGSHIVVRRRFEHDHGYLFEAPDRRVVFALPFADDFTLIGTTDENFVGDLNAPAPDVDEITYLCDVVNHYFRDKVVPDELAWSFAGVRALYDDGNNKPEDVTRDYELVLVFRIKCTIKKVHRFLLFVDMHSYRAKGAVIRCQIRRSLRP